MLAKKFKRALSLFLATVMTLSSVGMVTAFASGNNSEVQIVSREVDGKLLPVYYGNGTSDTDPVVHNSTNPEQQKVNISKTIAGTGVENQFEVTLNVNTKQHIEETVVSPSAAVNLVVDISGSMDNKCQNPGCGQSATSNIHTKTAPYCSDCGKDWLDGNNNGICDRDWCWGEKVVPSGTHAINNRLSQAKAAAISFLRSYAGYTKNADGTYSYTSPGASRYVSIVEYSSYAFERQNWIDLYDADVATANRNFATVEAAINGFTADGNTNTDEGLAKAEELWSQGTVKDIENRFTILLTDGEPNRNTGRLGEGYTVPAGYKLQDNRHFDNPAKRANKIMTDYKSDFYSIALGYEDGKTWLSGFSDKCVSADNAAELNKAFDEFIFRIKLAVDAWKVTDNMGADMTLGAVNTSGHNNNSITTDGNELTWNLRMDLTGDSTKITDENGNTVSKDTYQKNPDGNYTLSYTLKYLVNLDNLNANTASVFPVGGDTRLNYFLSKTNDKGETTYQDAEGKDIAKENALLTLAFKTPAVKSLFGTFEFTKAAYGKALPGAEFLLTHDADCHCGEGERSMMYANSTTAEMKNVSFANVPSGHRYSVMETKAPEGYTASTEKHPLGVVFGLAGNNTPTGRACGPDGIFTVENFLKETYTTFTVTKTWVDGGQTTRPEITIQLAQVKDGKETGKTWTATLDNSNATSDDNNTWSHTFENLPEKDVTDGKAYTYEATEVGAPDGYSSQVEGNGSSIINVSTGDVTISGTKTWVDDGNTTHPDVTIELVGRNGGVVKTETLEHGETSFTFAELPRFDQIGEIPYSIRESGIPTNYTVEKSGNYNLVNRINQQYAPLTVTVNWLDNGNAYTTRPETVTVEVSNGVGSIDLNTTTATVSQDGATWSYTFNTEDGKGFPVYKTGADGKVTGERINYTMTQSEALDVQRVDAYQTTVSGLSATNLLTGTTSVTGTKVWNEHGLSVTRPEVTIQLNGGERTTKLESDDTFAFEDLNKYTASGVKIPYTTVEVMYGENKLHFEANVVENADGSFTATNTYTAVTTISGQKSWVDNGNAYSTRPSSIQVQLVDVTNPEMPTNVGEPLNVTPNADGSWTYSFKDVPTVKSETIVVAEATEGTPATTDEEGNVTPGTEGTPAVTETREVDIVYAVQELNPAYGTLAGGISYDYKVSGGTAEDNYNLTNTLTGNVNITGTKTWNDNGNAWGTRPESALVEISNGSNVATTSLPLTDGSYSIDLPAFDASGVKITYSVKEQPIHGYTSVLAPNGRDFTNTLTQQYTKVDVNKTWIDGGKTEHDAITVNLLQNGVEIAEVVLESGVTAHTFFGANGETENALPLFQMDESGKVIGKYDYTVTEDAVAGYTTVVNGYNITNTLEGIEDTMNFSFTKQWLAPKEDYTLPLSEAVFTIKGGAEDITVTGDQMSWNAEKSLYEYTVESLPLFSEDGNTAYSYTVEETTVPAGYTSSRVNGTNHFLNTINAGEVTLNGAKNWVVYEGDSRSDFGIEVNVYRDESLLFTQTVPSSEQQFSFEILRDLDGQRLPMYAADGHKYVYSMSETPVPGFTTTTEGNAGTGYQFTNTFKTYTYQVNAHYTATVDGETKISEVRSIAEATTLYYDNRLVTLDTEAYKALDTAPEYGFAYTGGTVTLGESTTALGGNELTLSEDGQTYAIDLYYSYTFNSPIKYSVTVNYLDYATRSNPTPTAISTSNTTEGEINSLYNVSGWDRLPINGYQYVTTTGDAVTGSLDGNKTVNVWYSINAVDPGPGPGPIDPGPEFDPTEPDTEIPEEDVPLGELPEETPEVEIPDEDVPLAEEPEMEIPDEEVPLGDIPQTGDNSRMLLLGALALSSAAGMAYLTLSSRKKEEESK